MQPSTPEVRAQLERILASDLFKGSERLSRFLRYVVERACQGESDQLKEFVIGSEVFDRDASYDPRLDSVVRVEAGRLRSKLTEYYAGPGATDPVVITVPRGGYAPVVEAAAPIAAPIPPLAEIPAAAALPEAVAAPSASRPRPRVPRAALWAAGIALAALATFAAVWGNAPAAQSPPPPGRAVAVLPLSTYSTDEPLRLLATEVTEGVTRELARLGTVPVVSHVTAASAPPRAPLSELRQLLGATLIVGGNLKREDGTVRVEIALMDAVRDRKVRVDEFTGSMADLHDLERRVAEGISASVISQ